MSRPGDADARNLAAALAAAAGRTPADVMRDALEVARVNYELHEAVIAPLGSGRVHQTFQVNCAEGPLVLQKLHVLFQNSPAPGLNWLATEKRLETHSALPLMPSIMTDREGRLLSPLPPDGGVWRLTRFLPGRPPREKSPANARTAAALLGYIHYSLNTPAPLRLTPPPPGEFTNQRLCRPEEFSAIAHNYRGHPNLDDLRPVLDRAAKAAALLPPRPSFITVFQRRDVVIHGDPKMDNFLFNEEGQARALLDWDSMSMGHVLIDVAELLRSFGLAFGEDGRPRLSTPILRAVVDGYRSSGLELSDSEWSLLPAVLRGLAMNLARRYLVDSLAEVFFRWDPSRHPSLYAQNKSRAQLFLDLADHLLDRELELTRLSSPEAG